MTQDQPHTDKLAKAVLFCITAHFFFFVMGLSAKYLSATHHVAEITFYRNLIAFTVMLAFMLLAGKTHLFRTEKPRLLALRAVLGGISMILVFASLAHLPMAYATVIFYTSYLIIPLLAFLFLKERAGPHRLAAVAFGMIGVIIIARPSGEFSMLGLSLALITACFHSVIFTLLRALKTEHPVTITFYLTLAGCVLPGIVFMPWVASSILPAEIWVFLLIALSSGIGQISLASAYKYAPASFVTPFGYTSIIWNVLADIFYWKYDIDLWAVFAGAGLILTAQLYMIYREYVNKRKSS